MKNIYKTLKFVNQLILILALVFIGILAHSQNIAITDDDAYNAEASAMLDVKSVTKGLLVPRLSTEQRNAIASPAVGLLVYDTDNDGFFYFDGADWLTLPQMNTTGTGSALFAVLNTNGDTVFAVYEDGARVIVPLGAKGKVGGFAVSGRSPSKAVPEVEYLRVTPDSTRITFEEALSKGKVGGFAVSGRSPSKAGITTSSIINLFPDNYFIGDSSGINTTTGLYNSFFGYKSGKENTTGSNNVFMGYKAGISNETANNNVFIGNETGANIVDGFGNVLIGYQVAKNDVSSKYNSIIGYQAGLNNTGDYNSFYGFSAGNTNAGDYNSFFGPYAGFKNSGSYNVFMGFGSGYNNQTGSNNVFLGNWSGYANTTGLRNVMIGYYAGLNNTTASNNIYLGYYSGYYNSTGEFNTYIGYNSGAYAGYSTTNDPSFNTYIGYQTGYNMRQGAFNTFIGYNSGYSANSASTTGSRNTALGYKTGYSLTTGISNVFIGDSTGYTNSTGAYNVFIGSGSGTSNQDGNYNTFIGHQAGFKNTGTIADSYSGDDNTFVGYQAGYNATTGYRNIAIGWRAGYGITDNRYNVCIGELTGSSLASGQANVLIGTYAGRALNGGQGNIILGLDAGYTNIAGNDNVYIGLGSGRSATGSNCVFMGNYSGYGELGDSKLVIESSEYTGGDNENNALIYGEFDNNIVNINGKLGVGIATPSAFLHVFDWTEVSASSGGGIIIGNEVSSNLGMDANEIQARSNGTATTLFMNPSGGNVGLSNSGSTTTVYGDLVVWGTYTNPSDKRLKRDIIALNYGLNEILKLNPVSFYWKDNSNNKKQLGFIAQEIKEILPELVFENNEGFLSVDYIKIIPVLVGSIKEQQLQINKQQKQIDLLIQEIENLKK